MLSSRRNFFSFLGLPRKLNLDIADLDERYRTLSRQFHPDYFFHSPPSERRASLESTSYLNDAYRTLKNPVGRIEYLLKLEGLVDADARPANPGSPAVVPPALLEQVFALNEELDEIRAEREQGAPADRIQARLDRARVTVERQHVDHEECLRQLSVDWDATGDRRVLEALKERLAERNYIKNLLAGIERELAALENLSA
jgi:molecular chaperone HscB